MKLERAGIAVVSAQAAAAPSFLKQPFLGVTPPCGHAFLATELASVVAATLEHMLDHSVGSTVQLDDPRQSRGGGWPIGTLSGSLTPQLVPIQPMVDGGLTHGER